MAHPYPNFQSGLIRNGSYTDRILFGGLKESEIGSGVENEYTTESIETDKHLTADLIKRNVSVSDSTLYTWDLVNGTCFRIIVSDILTLLPDGFISCSGAGGFGFAMDTAISAPGTLGGSGSGGAALGNGLPDPTDAYTQQAKRWLGGNGGAGVDIGGGGVPGTGGNVYPVANFFDPGIFQLGTVFSNFWWSDEGGDLLGQLLPWRICGGAGGGGAGTGGGIGGAGGGVVYIAANKIVMAGGSIHAQGYAGATGSGGGGGGAVVISCADLVWTGAGGEINVHGGLASGLSEAGDPGNILIFSNQILYRFDGGVVDQESYEKAVVRYQAKGRSFNHAY